LDVKTAVFIQGLLLSVNKKDGAEFRNIIVFFPTVTKIREGFSGMEYGIFSDTVYARGMVIPFSILNQADAAKIVSKTQEP
jgi:hypothetical protein